MGVAVSTRDVQKRAGHEFEQLWRLQQETLIKLQQEQAKRLQQEKLLIKRLEQKELKRLQQEKSKKRLHVQKRREKLIGSRIDVYDPRIKKINKWWPCTIIEVNGDSIKVRYDEYTSKWDEWIALSSGRIATIHKHTKKTRERIQERARQGKFKKLQQQQMKRLQQEKLKRAQHEKLKRSQEEKAKRLQQEQMKRLQELKAKRLEKQRKLWMNKRVDAYDKVAWWPSTVIDVNMDSILVTYDGYSSKYDEWIKINSDRISTIHTHTKKHQTHQALTVEAERRKTEWRRSSYCGSHVNVSIECPYYDACNDLMERFVNATNINTAMFEPKGHRCFCQNCHDQRSDVEAYKRGNPSQTYVLPIGYARFGIKLTSEQRNVLNDWHVVYHGTKVSYLPDICQSGLILLKPNDFKLSESTPKYKTIKIRSGHIPRKFKRINKHTNKPEIFDPEQIFTSVSPTYSSKYCDVVRIDEQIVSFMFQCRQKPGSYSRGQETMGYGDVEIDKYVSNESIEFYTKHHLDIIITGILIKLHNFEEEEEDVESSLSEEESETECDQCKGSGQYEIGKCFRCNGKGECNGCRGSGLFKKQLSCKRCDGSGVFKIKKDCFKCNGTGTFRKRVSCKRCDGTGRFRNGCECNACDGSGIYEIKHECDKCGGDGLFKRDYECKKCKGSGIFQPEIKCGKCKASGGCSKCDNTGKFKVKCRKCDGRGTV
eukprot:590005_1